MANTVHIGKKHIFTDRKRSGDILISAGVSENLVIESGFGINTAVQYVSKKEHFPTAVNGVITLENDKTYIVLGTVDMTGDRFQCANNTIIKGTSSETSNLLSTGLALGTPLFTSTKTIIFQNITVYGVNTVFSLNGSDDSQVIDWDKFNIEECATMGNISNYGNFIMTNSAILNSAVLTFDGTIGTIGFLNCLITNFRNLPTLVINDTCTITRRFKLVESSMVVTGGGTGITFSTSATVPNQGYILTSCNFSGGGTYLSGVAYTDNKTLFFKNLGINNSRSIGGYYLSSSSATTLVQDTWTKAAGVTTANPNNQKFSHTNNQLTYTGTLTQIMNLLFSISLTGTNNDSIEVGLSLNGNDPQQFTTNVSTIDAGGAITFLGGFADLELSENDYVSVYCKNLTGSRNITSTKMSLLITGQF